MAVAVDFANPMLWAVLIGWILSVTLHEFAHGLAAHLGGDYTIRERGGLTLNPFQYVDPMMSILLPAVFLMMGGIPLPGGATYVRRDLLRNRFWQSMVSAAGPLMNLLLFAILALLVHPRFGWINHEDPSWVSYYDVQLWTNAQLFVGAMAFLQLLAAILNLVPVPPLDGFGIIAPWLRPELRDKLSTPPLSTYLFLGYFMALFWVPGFLRALVYPVASMLNELGLSIGTLQDAFRRAMGI